MKEPKNHEGVIDAAGGTWVRADDMPGRYGNNWWPRTDGPGWDTRVHNGIGTPRTWDQMKEHGPFKKAPRRLVEETLALVRKVWR